MTNGFHPAAPNGKPNHERMMSHPQAAPFMSSTRSQRSDSRSFVPRTGAEMMPAFSNGMMAGYEESFLPPVTLYDMVSAQMEYYFSLDNLCKDMFLRKHMDSQGFVFLHVIAGFNRMVQLTTDLDLVRYVCMNSHRIDFRPGQMWPDGRDRVRAVENWHQFVLSREQRDASIVGADTPTLPPQVPFVEPTHSSLEAPHAFSPPGSMNGSGHHTPVPLSAAVSEFAPMGASQATLDGSQPMPQD